MYFKPRDSAFYSFAVSLSPLKRYCMTIAAITVVVCAWLFCIYMPLAARIVEYKTQSSCLQTQCVEYGCARKQCGVLQEEISALNTEFDICTGMCVHTTPSLCMTGLINCVKTSGIQVTSCTTQNHSKEAWYTEDTITLSGQGTLAQLCSFFEQASKMEYPLAYMQYSVTSASNGEYAISCSYSLRANIKKPFNLEQAEGLGG